MADLPRESDAPKDLTYESLSPALKLRVNAHIMNAFLEEGDYPVFLNQFRRVANSLPYEDGENRANNALDALRDALATHAKNLKPVDAQDVPSVASLMGVMQNEVLGLINGELKSTHGSGGGPAYNKPERFRNFINKKISSINTGKENPATRKSNLFLQEDDLEQARKAMGLIELTANIRPECLRFNSKITCESILNEEISPPQVASTKWEPLQR